MNCRTIRCIALTAFALLVCVPLGAGAQEIGLAAREAFAQMVPEGSLIVYGTVIDTVEHHDTFLPFGDFAGIVDPPRGSSLRWVHARFRIERVLRGRAPEREITFGVPIGYVPGPDTLGASTDSAKPAAGAQSQSGGAAGLPPRRDGDAGAGPKVQIGPGFTGIVPLLVEPLAPGGYLLATESQAIPEQDGKVLSEDVMDLSVAARAFYRPRDIESLTLDADAIVLATVSRIRAACQAQGDTVFDCVDLDVQQTFKTDVDSTLTVLIPDATATSWRVPILRSDIPDLEAGEEHYFFLSRGAEGRWRLLEGRSGVVHSEHGWIVEWPRRWGTVIGLNMDAPSFGYWVSHTIERALNGQL